MTAEKRQLFFFFFTYVRHQPWCAAHYLEDSLALLAVQAGLLTI